MMVAVKIDKAPGPSDIEHAERISFSTGVPNFS
jgi:hypothetical protein